MITIRFWILSIYMSLNFFKKSFRLFSSSAFELVFCGSLELKKYIWHKIKRKIERLFQKHITIYLQLFPSDWVTFSLKVSHYLVFICSFHRNLVSSVFEAVSDGAAMGSVNFFISGNVALVFDDSPSFGMEVSNCNSSTSSIDTASSMYHLTWAFLSCWINFSTMP